MTFAWPIPRTCPRPPFFSLFLSGASTLTLFLSVWSPSLSLTRRCLVSCFASSLHSVHPFCTFSRPQRRCSPDYRLLRYLVINLRLSREPPPAPVLYPSATIGIPVPPTQTQHPIGIKRPVHVLPRRDRMNSPDWNPPRRFCIAASKQAQEQRDRRRRGP